jgi:ribosome maturation factor RimP
MRESLIRLLEPEVSAEGLELVELEAAAHKGGGLLRLYIDRPGATVTVEDCERVSRRLGPVLDAADPIAGAYTLEVSSPGLDRPLRTPAHFARAVGARVKVEIKVARAGRARYTGRLLGAAEGRIRLEVDGNEVELGHDEVRKARVIPEF